MAFPGSRSPFDAPVRAPQPTQLGLFVSAKPLALGLIDNGPVHPLARPRLAIPRSNAICLIGFARSRPTRRQGSSGCAAGIWTPFRGDNHPVGSRQDNREETERAARELSASGALCRRRDRSPRRPRLFAATDVRRRRAASPFPLESNAE